MDRLLVAGGFPGGEVAKFRRQRRFWEYRLLWAGVYPSDLSERRRAILWMRAHGTSRHLRDAVEFSFVDVSALV